MAGGVFKQRQKEAFNFEIGDIVRVIRWEHTRWYNPQINKLSNRLNKTGLVKHVWNEFIRVEFKEGRITEEYTFLINELELVERYAKGH